MKPPRFFVTRALAKQVTAARPFTGTECDVVTFISRPMWRAFLTEMGCDPDDEPTGWTGDITTTRRVYGSETFVFELGGMVSFSMAKSSHSFGLTELAYEIQGLYMFVN